MCGTHDRGGTLTPGEALNRRPPPRGSPPGPQRPRVTKGLPGAAGGAGPYRPNASPNQGIFPSASFSELTAARCPPLPPPPRPPFPCRSGGIYVRTRIGPIQIGMPPESIKDSFALGLPLPQFFLLPAERLCRITGLNVADFGARGERVVCVGGVALVGSRGRASRGESTGARGGASP